MSDDLNLASENPADTSQDITFECPMCGKAMVVGPEGAGEVIMCPACDQEIIVPGGPQWEDTAQAEGGPLPAAQVEESVDEPIPPRMNGITHDMADLLERLRTLENQLRENQTQCTASAESITQALNQATRYKLNLQRLEEKRRVLQSMVDDTKQRIASMERLG